MKRFLFLAALVGTSLSSQVFSQDKKPAAKPPARPEPILDLQDDDTFVFLGDSITHQCLYTQYVEDFFYTRYPDRKIIFHNAGVSGDKAADALARFDDDVAAFKPKFVSVLLGMNDGKYEDFSAETFATYEADMTALSEKLDAINTQAIPMSPTLFDHHQLALERANNPKYRFGNREFSPQYNALMAFYGAWLRGAAGENDNPYINLYGPLNDLTEQQRRTDPDFTLVPDAIHPDAAGQFVMAYQFLWQLTPDRRSVSAIIVSKGKKGWNARVSGGEVTDLKVSETADSVRFNFLARSLPWVVPEETFGPDIPVKWDDRLGPQVGYKLTNAGHRLSNERLKIVGLKPGKYLLKIDGREIGEFTNAQLGAKVELQSNENTPQYLQALRVAELNRARNDKAIRPLRDTWGRIKGLRRQAAAESKPELFQEKYDELKPKIAALLLLGAEYETKIYAEAKPILRLYELELVK